MISMAVYKELLVALVVVVGSKGSAGSQRLLYCLSCHCCCAAKQLACQCRQPGMAAVPGEVCKDAWQPNKSVTASKWCFREDHAHAGHVEFLQGNGGCVCVQNKALL